jgi:hypothetical protein
MLHRQKMFIRYKETIPKASLQDIQLHFYYYSFYTHTDCYLHFFRVGIGFLFIYIIYFLQIILTCSFLLSITRVRTGRRTASGDPPLSQMAEWAAGVEPETLATVRHQSEADVRRTQVLDDEDVLVATSAADEDAWRR